jgi:hypothetical protein
LSDDILWSAGSCVLDPEHLPDGGAKDLEETNERRSQVRKDWVDGNGRPLRHNAPLWYYILREAEYYGVGKCAKDPGIGFGGQHLGPVGSRIVAETLIGLLWLDAGSFLHDLRGFRPMQCITGGRPLTLPILIEYALT